MYITYLSYVYNGMNVVDLENPGGSGFQVRGHMGQVREMGSQFTSNPGKR